MNIINQQVGALFGLILLLMIVWAVAIIVRSRKAQKNMAIEQTPVTEEGLAQFDDLPAALAVALCWSEPGDNPRWHRKMQEEVRDRMPVLARALDRLIEH